MDSEYTKKIITFIIVAALAILSFLLLKPILLDIVLGFILAFIFYPLYKFLLRISKSPNLSASFITVVLVLIILIPIWFFTPIIINQAFKLYASASQTDFAGLFESIFPSLFSSEQFASEIGSALNSFIPNIANYLLNALSNFLLDFPSLLLHSLVVLFTFYFALRDKQKINSFLNDMSPFSKDVNKKISQSSRDITSSVLYGQVVLGLLQGAVLAIGIFVLGIPNSFLLTIVSLVVGILPIIGPMFVWIPLAIYLFVSQDMTGVIVILIFGLISSNLDTFLRPMLVSRKTKVHSGIVFIGMIGGLFLLGILGLILGPLILVYLLIFLEVLRGNTNLRDGFLVSKKD